jgi:cytochrome c-type biogenesis protein CcmH/NrfG
MFREAIKNDPAFPRAMVNLAATLASESKFSEADAVVQQALQLDPENKEALQLQAMLNGQGSQ